ncbi:hypothetical protein LDENG_00252930 [Lucifuga dentata]|nr:hypothetical protein LDENG_00252930 [Lucifuga dentata]
MARDVVFFTPYCNNHPVGLRFAWLFFSLGLANRVQEAGGTIRERARVGELLNKANSTALRKRLYPSASTSTGNLRTTLKTRQIFHINDPMDY